MNRHDFEDAGRAMLALSLLSALYIALAAIDWSAPLLLGEQLEPWRLVVIYSLSWVLYESAVRVGYLGFVADRLGPPRLTRGMIAIAREYFGRRLFLFTFLLLMQQMVFVMIRLAAQLCLGGMEMDPESQRYVFVGLMHFLAIPLDTVAYYFDFYILVLLLTGQDSLERLVLRLVVLVRNPRLHGVSAYACCYGGLALLAALLRFGFTRVTEHPADRPALLVGAFVVFFVIHAAMTWVLLAAMGRYHKQRALADALLSPRKGEINTRSEE